MALTLEEQRKLGVSAMPFSSALQIYEPGLDFPYLFAAVDLGNRDSAVLLFMGGNVLRFVRNQPF